MTKQERMGRLRRMVPFAAALSIALMGCATETASSSDPPSSRAAEPVDGDEREAVERGGERPTHVSADRTPERIGDSDLAGNTEPTGERPEILDPDRPPAADDDPIEPTEGDE